uniref:DDHD domain-containing protein n=1 Tax=Ascaris lumbricoides TaxID=6252 RepID=A0A9J2PI88_ASCLU
MRILRHFYMLYKKKKSRLDSSGEGSGVEIITNKPYDEGPGGSGQYTFKIYHIGSKIPAWIRSVLPTAALQAHEEAWNAYPYTKTRYSSPIMDRFSVEVETKYFNDAGERENVFELKGDELRARIVDVMDFVNDPIASYDYAPDEDPKLYQSVKTGRGPLTEDWVNDCVQNHKPIMCAYKLCKVEFRYWGLQSRAERWIQGFALRNTMLRAHRQAWAWQDEWTGLSIEEIRRLESEVAEHLSRVMAHSESADSDTSSDVYFDCIEPPSPDSNKPSLIRWSSELLITDGESPPLTPRPDSNTSLLIIVFHGDISPELPAEHKMTDVNSLKATVESLISSHYPQLKSRIHFIAISCGNELNAIVSQLVSISPSCNFQAVQSTIVRANQAYTQFIHSEAGGGFNGEIFVVGDHLGGLLLYESLKKISVHLPVSRHSSSISANSRAIPEDCEQEASWSVAEFPLPENMDRSHIRNLSAPPSTRRGSQRLSTSSESDFATNLNFRVSAAFLLGCPLALVLTQRKMFGIGLEPLDCGQLFNLYYALDPCGARLEPLLNSHLAVLPPMSVPQYRRFPLGDGRHIHFDSTLDSSLLWGIRRIDHTLYCPHAMVALPSSALPHILHASYWESSDVAAFILRQFIRSEDTPVLAALTNMSTIPSEIQMEPPSWNRRRTKFKQVTNLAPNHRANDVIVVEGAEQQIHARFCYGPVDLVALSREKVSAYVCPVGGDWQLIASDTTDSHGRISFSMGTRLPVGIHCVKMIVHGDRSFLDLFIAVVPRGTRFVVFSVDGSLTGSVSVTGRDPRVRPGAVDVVRFWHDLGYLIIYMTARPDMQQKVVGAWLALHNFPHALLFFTPSFSTDPLRQKTLHLKALIDMGVCIHAAYGSSKDVSVYTSAGIEAERIFSVSGGKRRGCVPIDGYSTHLSDLNNGAITFAQPVDSSLIYHHNNSFTFNNQRNLVQRTHSFTPRSGRYSEKHKEKR